MSKKRDSLTISEDLSNIFSDRLKSDRVKKESAENRYTFNLTIDKALDIVVRQMKATGLHARNVSRRVHARNVTRSGAREDHRSCD